MISVARAVDGQLAQVVSIGEHRLVVDVPVAAGGQGSGPEPHDLLDAALGACTALTVTMVAQRRQMPLQDVRVHVEREESGGVYRLSRQVELVGALSAEQREYLLGIANKCPIHKALNGRFEILTELLP